MKRPDKKAAEMSVRELAAYIDYSVLKPEFTEEEINFAVEASSADWNYQAIKR